MSSGEGTYTLILPQREEHRPDQRLFLSSSQGGYLISALTR
jgi:hypothetical protein